MLSVKTKLSTIEILISKVLIDLHVNHGKFVSVTNVLREHNEVKEKIKTPENAVVLQNSPQGL